MPKPKTGDGERLFCVPRIVFFWCDYIKVMTTIRYGNELLWAASSPQKLKIGVVLSGGEAPGRPTPTVIYGPFVLHAG